MENTFEIVSGLIANKLEVEPSSIQPESKLEELGLDSLDIFDIIFEAEDKFGIKVPNPTEQIVTVQDVVRMLDALLAEKGTAE